MSYDDNVTEIVNRKNKAEEAEKVTNVLQLIGAILGSQKYHKSYEK